MGGGRFRLIGQLDAASVVDVLADSRQRFAEFKRIHMDLSGVTESDSAGLALVLEWFRLSRIADRKIQFHHLPPQISALARISEVEDLFGAGEVAPATAEEQTAVKV